MFDPRVHDQVTVRIGDLPTELVLTVPVPSGNGFAVDRGRARKPLHDAL